MRIRKTCKANILLIAAVAAFGVSGSLAMLDGGVSGRAFAIGIIGLAVATAALAANTRQVAGDLAVTVKRAPREQYWRGYEDRGVDSAAVDVPGPDPYEP